MSSASDTELAVVGMVLSDPRLFEDCLVAGLTAEHFLDTTARAFWEWIAERERSGKDFDYAAAALGIGPQHPEAFEKAIRIAPITRNVDFYAREVMANAWRLRTIGRMRQLIAKLEQAEKYADVSPLMAEIESLADDQGPQVSKTWEPADLVREQERQIEEIHREYQAGRSYGIPTGLDKLDKSIYGWLPQRLHILAARPAEGKTTIGLQLALNAAKAGYATAYFTNEMDGPELAHKITSSLAGVSHAKFLKGNFSERDFDEINRAHRVQSDTLLYINDDTDGSFEKFRAEAQRLVRRHGVKFICYDYLQQLHCARTFESRQKELEYITRELKNLAKRLHVPLLVPAQLNRLADATAPSMAHIKDSGSTEQDADVVIGIYKPAQSCPVTGNTVALRMMKARNAAKKEFFIKTNFEMNQIGD